MSDGGVNTQQIHNGTFAGARQKSKLIPLKNRLFSVISAHILCQDEGTLGQAFGNSACAK